MHVAKLGNYYIGSYEVDTKDGSISSIMLTKSLNKAQFFDHDNLRRSTHDQFGQMGVKFCKISIDEEQEMR